VETVYQFMVTFDNVSRLDEAVFDALHEAGCDDATFMISKGVMIGGFDRKAQTLQDAIASAIKDIEKANIGARILSIEIDNFKS
jgi:hypothetical protein